MPEAQGGRGGSIARRIAGDASGGAVSALIALPYGLAMARLMGLPPALGLFTSIVAGPVATALGRNPVLIGGAASATVPFVAAAVRAQGVGGSAKVCLAASVFLMAFGVLRLGRHAARVPHAVVSGFSCGVGAMMVILQIRPLLGLPAASGPVPAGTLGQLASALAEAGGARLGPILLGSIVIAGALAAARRWPKSPAPTIGIALAFVATPLLGDVGPVVGLLAPGLPPLASFRWEPADVAAVLPEAFGLAIVASVNILITSRVVEHFRGRHRPLRAADADAELGAYGIANLCAGIFGAPMSVGIPARSLANVRSGGTTRLSILLHSAFLLGFVGLGSGLIARIPVTALAGVTAFVGVGLLEWSTWRRLPRMRRIDAAAFLATAAAVVATNAIAAVAVGCSLHAAHHLATKFGRPLPALRRALPREVDA